MEAVQSRIHKKATFPHSYVWHFYLNIGTVSSPNLVAMFFQHYLGVKYQMFQMEKSEDYVLKCQLIVKNEKIYIDKCKWTCSKAKNNTWNCPRF